MDKKMVWRRQVVRRGNDDSSCRVRVTEGSERGSEVEVKTKCLGSAAAKREEGVRNRETVCACWRH